MLGLDNPIHIAFVLVLLLLVFGAKRLPEMGRSLGAGLRGFKESISGDEPQPTIAERAPTSFAERAPTSFPQPAPVTEPSERPVEPVERTPAGTAA